MTNLNEWFGAIERSGEIAKNRNKEFNEKLPEPNSVFSFQEYHYGYWKCDGGVIRIEKKKNGYSQYSQIFFSDIEINAINKAREE